MVISSNEVRVRTTGAVRMVMAACQRLGTHDRHWWLDPFSDGRGMLAFRDARKRHAGPFLFINLERTKRNAVK